MKTSILKNCIYIFLILGLLSGTAGHASEMPWISADHVQARLLRGEVRGLESEAALHMRLGDGWHTYWRVPGDAGLPPRFDWSGSRNVENVEIHWPFPKRKKELEFYTFAYTDEVTFPLMVKLKDADKDTILDLKLAVMVCRDICIPQNLELSMELEKDSSSFSQQMIDYAKREVPETENTPALKIESVVAGPDGFVINTFSQKGYEQSDIFIEVDGFGFTSSPEISTDAQDSRIAMIKVSKPSDIDSLVRYLEGKSVSITFTDGKSAIESITEF